MPMRFPEDSASGSERVAKRRSGDMNASSTSDTHVSLTSRPTWKALVAHHGKARNVHLRTLFADDPARGERLTVEAAGVFLDYSKNHITDDTLRLLLALAAECG